MSARRDKTLLPLKDAAQGSECTAAILSAGMNWGIRTSVGFLYDRRRVNVAASRCEMKIVMDEVSLVSAWQVIDAARFLRDDGKFLVSGDNQQLEGFSYIQ